MSSQKITLDWVEPLDLAQKIADNYKSESWIFLYSGLNDEINNSNSYIAVFAEEEFIGDSFASGFKNNLKDITSVISNNFRDNISNSNHATNHQNQWFGYVSYEANTKHKTQESFINLPKIWLTKFSLVFEFNHNQKLLNAYFSKQEQLDEILNYKTKNLQIKKVETTNFNSNFSDAHYLQTIDELKQMIACGDFYQVNLTRKFFGNINYETQQEFFSLFTKLDKISPANYSSFLKLRDNFIISSSPELFLNIKDSIITSRPIKGTAARSNDATQDQQNKEYLQNSEKEKAENLMIVDLVRNDISQVSKAGSVKVNNLFQVNSYKTLHHMSSEISGKIAENFNVIDCFESCFPAGSMTGAPKIKAMEIIAQKEKLNRGVYSGAIGYFKGDEANFSVVIRTLICQKNKFEFQVGGAITFACDTQKELEETFVKAKAIKQVLDLKM